ncbi:14954_t:CDS:2, partial [Acaulospora colombiana]
PITERVFSAFMHLPNSTKMEEDDTYRGHGMGRAAGQGTVGDLEERLMKECRALGLILDNDEPDYTQPQDDQIASELRRCQRALRAQIKINEARKKRLLAIAEMRLAYAEYEEIKEGMERNISNMFAKLGNSGVPKVTRKKKKEKDKVAAAAAVDPASGGPAGISGLGLVGMDGNLQIPTEIYEPVKVLKQWKATLGAMYDQLEAETPGVIRGLPQKSIYEGIEDELVETQTVTSTAPDNAMDGVVTNGDADQSMDVVPFASSPDDGNLDERVTDAIVWELMLQAGPDRISMSHQGYGFCEFLTEEDAEYACKIMNQIKLWGKPIRVNKVSFVYVVRVATDCSVEKASSDKKQIDVGANLFIGNLDPAVDERLLYDTFSVFGALTQPAKVRNTAVIYSQRLTKYTQIARDPATQQSKGHGFVSYADFESADAAIEAMNKQYLMNKLIEVQYAFKKDGKGERHGTHAERLLAAQARKNMQLPLSARPPPAPAALVSQFGMRPPMPVATPFGGAYQGQFAGALAPQVAPPVGMGMPGMAPTGMGVPMGIPPPPPGFNTMYPPTGFGMMPPPSQ